MFSLFCLGYLLIAPLYISLTLAVLLSVISPILRALASHGKTRTLASTSVQGRAEKQQRKIKSDAKPTKRIPWSLRSLQQFLLESDAVLVDKRRFRHFYVVGIVCTTATWVYSKQGQPSSENDISTLLLLIHLCRRTYECTYVHNWGKGKMHIGGYFLGVVHYAFIPFVFVETDWCCGYERTAATQGTSNSTHYQTLGLVRMVASTLLCLYGQAEQHRHHKMLAKLRMKGESDGKSNIAPQYRIPAGRWFQYVSSPHYLAEILIYLSFAALLHPVQEQISCHPFVLPLTIPMVDSAVTLASTLAAYKHYVLLVWVATNLSVSARNSHKWYLEQFGTYPKDRRAIIPFLF